MNGTNSTAAVCLVSTMLVLTVVLAAPALADESCALLDPTCVVDTMEKAVVDTTETVGEVTDTVDQATETADEIVDDTTNGVDDVVDDTVGGGVTEPGHGGNGGEGNGGGQNGGGGGDDPDGAARRRAVRPAVIVASADSVSSSDITPSVGVASRNGGSPERRTVGLALVPLATSVAVMLLLLGLVVGFVTFQHALDRRDPKLAPDILGSESDPLRMTITRSFGGDLRPVAGEVVPLRERMAYMAVLRTVLGAVVVAAIMLGVGADVEPGLVVWVTAAYLALSLSPFALRRLDPARLLPLTRGMLVIDGIYLAWAMLQTGGPFSPLRSLLFVHVIVVMLLVSYRTGLKDTAWLTLLFLIVTEASGMGLGGLDPDRSPDDAALVASLTIAALWAIAFSTATFSAINERALRRQNSQLARLAAMTEEIDGAGSADDIPTIVLEALRETFGFTRGVVVASPRDDLQVLASMGSQPLPRVDDGLDPLMDRAWLQREPTLVRRIDPEVDGRLAMLMPDAVNVLIVPLFLPKGYRLGLIALEHATARDTMRRRELLMVSQFSSHAALALHSAWLTEERAAKLEEIQTLQREIVAHNARLEIAVAERTEQLRDTIDDLERVDAQRRHLLQGLVRAQEDERTRLANDIHDDPLQKLVSVKMRVELLQRAGDHVDELGEIHETMRSCITSLRFMLFDLRPPILDERGLAPAIERFLDQSGMQATSSIRDEVSKEIDPEVRVILYRIAQEALTNVKKHADASHVAIRLRERDDGTLMRISDDGVGFQLDDVDGARPGHLGLGSMRERAEMAGGECSLFSLPGAGTTLEVWLPPVRPELPANAVAPPSDNVLLFREDRPA